MTRAGAAAIVPRILLWAALVPWTAACASSSPGPDLGAMYRAAVDDAREAEASEVVRLRPLRTDARDVRWRRLRGGERHALVVTLTPEAPASEGENVTLDGDTWVTLAPELQEFCRGLGLTGPDLVLRMEQYLGLPAHSGRGTVVGLWVSPTDVFRPCPDPEVDDTRCGVDEPGAMSAEHRRWYRRQMAAAYEGEPRYPWTRLGYTYDWGSSGSPVGASEYVVRAGAEVQVASVQSPDAFCGVRGLRPEQDRDR